MWIADPWSFKDPIASSTSWKPLPVSHSSLFSKKLHRNSKNQLVYKISLQRKIFGVMFVLTGLLTFASVAPVDQGQLTLDLSLKDGLLLFFGIMFFLFGAMLLFRNTSLALFDGDKEKLILRIGPDSKAVSFSEIHAVQLIPDFVYGDRYPDSFVGQLNVVLKDNTRLNLSSYDNLKIAENDCIELASFVDIKAWDALGFY